MTSNAPFEDVTGVILAGGKSSRYGKNKALVEFEGVPLIERVTEVIQSLFQHVIISTNTPDEYAHLKFPKQEDLIKGLGPLGGIFTALMSITDEAGFFVACDMPCLNPGLIRYMVDVKENFDAVVPRIHGNIEAIHALYSKRCLPYIRRLIDARQYQIFRFFADISVRYVDENEIRRFDPDLKSFFNINEPKALGMVTSKSII